MDSASTEADINTIMANEFFSNALITAGWLQPLTFANRHRALQTIIVYDALMKRKAPLDQFTNGLKTLGVHVLIKSSPELMKPYFVNTTGPLTSDDLVEILKFPDNDENQMAKEFLTQATRQLEDGLIFFCLLIYLFDLQRQHMPITVGPYSLMHPVSFPCGRKSEYPEKTYDFWHSVDILFLHEDWVRVTLWNPPLENKPGTSEVKCK